ncbi:hypothetical protein TNCV_796131 [Trichonephila clavipes]|nr:hypothetical protein TNCV_796131 [Trichonephila clavipes]
MLDIQCKHVFQSDLAGLTSGTLKCLFFDNGRKTHLILIYLLCVPVPKPDGIGNVFEGVVCLTRQKELEGDRKDVQKLLDSYNHELTIDELIEMHEQEQCIEYFESLDPVLTEDQITVGNSTEGLNLIEKGYKFF